MSSAPSVYKRDGIIYVRASAFGKCERALWAIYDGVQPMEHSDVTKRAFQEGHLHEEAVWQERTQQGYVLYGDQQEVELRILPNRLHIVGHIDGFIELGTSTEYDIDEYGNGGPRLWECKAMSRKAFEDWQRGRWEYRPGYKWQLAIYMHGTHTERAHYDVKRRDDGLIDTMLINEPPYELAAIRSRALHLYKIFTAGEMPPCTADSGEKWFCNYWFLHDEEVPLEVGKPEIPVDEIPELNEILGMYHEANETKKWAEKQIKEAKEKLKAKYQNGRLAFGTDLYTVEISQYTQATFDKARFIAKEGQELLDKYTEDSPRERWLIKPRPKGELE